MTRLRLLYSLLILSCTACVSIDTKHDTNKDLEESQQVKQKQLYQVLISLSGYVIPEEALAVAEHAIHYPKKLAKNYNLTTGPIVHNMLVNSGVKDRGLCIHWTEDLIRHLSSLKLKSLKFYWAVANRESTFALEHSAPLVTAVEKEFEDGIILDAWRNSGALHFVSVGQDIYQWKKHYNEVTAELILAQ